MIPRMEGLEDCFAAYVYLCVLTVCAYSDKLPYEQESKEVMKEGRTSKVV